MLIMKAKDLIIDTIKKSQDALTAAQIGSILGINRTYVSRVLNALKASDQVESHHIGKNVFYHLSNRRVIFHRVFQNHNIEEGEIWRMFANDDWLIEHTSQECRTIVQYAFTEMLNNAIEHSQSQTIDVFVAIIDENLQFAIRDFGIGVFRNVQRHYHLPSEIDAIQELMKGKNTTAPRAHSGEGIFWTSKCAKLFTLASFNYKLIVNHDINDFTIQQLDSTNEIHGTMVSFLLPTNTDKQLLDLFRAYSTSEELALNTTLIPLKLYSSDDTWISRSQARRVLVGLDKFDKITFDFSGVDLVGQAFCDEVFRVFRHEHPNITLNPINMNESVTFMVNRALNDNTWV